MPSGARGRKLPEHTFEIKGLSLLLGGTPRQPDDIGLL